MVPDGTSGLIAPKLALLLREGERAVDTPYEVGSARDPAATLGDAQLIAQLIVGRIGSLPCGKNGDVNENGGVTSVDAQLIAQLIVGRISSLPPP